MCVEKKGDWLEKKFLQWQISEGGRRTVDEFAAHLGSSQSYISMVMRGHRTPSFDLVGQWAERLGPDVYDAFGYKRPDPLIDKLLEAYDAVPEDRKEEFVREFMNRISEMINR